MSRGFLRTPKPFGERSNIQDRDYKKRFFLVVEGSATEKEYFTGIFNYRQELGIDLLVDIIIVDREEEYESYSHPKHLLAGIIEKLDNEEISLNQDLDEIWLIFDRDEGNFSRGQFDEIYEECAKRKFNIGLTNPAFEFWLLLHVVDITEYDPEKLLKNVKVSNEKRCIDKILSDKLGGYKKSNIRFERFKENIDCAIEQERKFEQKLPQMFERLGSNIGVLISRMRVG